ncbi:unnamed protein product [Schistosoma margrebowiei]|uniref:Uncharacterized protein n=1 Tax=Schistosoma margrebowiei TaxID=48269 RepID=A0A183LIC5_9TREM|nr:unnamed protein product [Schistosoma margrebowiei]
MRIGRKIIIKNLFSRHFFLIIDVKYLLRYNIICINQITLDGKDLEDRKTFTYLGIIIDEHDGSDADVKVRISKAKAAYRQFKNILNSKQLSTNTKKDKEDVRIRREADIASNHHLVEAKKKVKLKKHMTIEETILQTLNTTLLRDNNELNKFKITINSSFKTLHDLLKEEETTMEDNRKDITEAIT